MFARFAERGQRQLVQKVAALSLSMSGESPAKKANIMVKIGTHNGTFHCDEVLACFMLKQLPQYRDAEILRTRESSLLDECDIVVDVGGVYNPENHRYDHHQRNFKECMNSLNPHKKWITKLSSAGLVYFHFGHEILSHLLGLSVQDPTTELIYDKVYENFLEEVDAIDNGIDATNEEPRYKVTTTISNRVARMNPRWNEENVDEDKCFHKAMDMVGAEFLDRVNFYKATWLPARDIVLRALNARTETHSTGEIISLSEGGSPWKDHLFTLEEELGISPPIKYVLYPDSNSQWRVQCVPLRLGSFDNRLPLSEEWRGLRDEELSQKCGIPNCIFVHSSGFIGGNKTYEGALAMAAASLQKVESR
ncbi:UPF0160 protein MYG1, mitochondrial-like isoform X2 [Pomacea canaliculata]|uniref:UPF0160 protein MYG1, mitochondrial-like isoform X2 n=1 Tax=Pomacea canaliculata TaxID=400727 RepID=UPI000D729CCA|nr:UPF0160 protein MYG1, mitochondrial-like isoform X2 [Pomacea canaliculata]